MSTPKPLSLSRETARAFARLALGLETPHPDVSSALAHHGYVQIDPINVCGRMHDLILRNRVADYREGDLYRHAHGDTAPLPAESRTCFEHHLPTHHILVALEVSAWPYLKRAMAARSKRDGNWSGKLTAEERPLAKRLIAEITEKGPLNSEAIDDNRQAPLTWGRSTLVKSTLQKLFFHGHLLISGRDRQRRFYDLPERVLPAAVLALPDVKPAEESRWEVLLKLRQRRLCTLKRTELPHVADLVQSVRVEGCPPLWILREDAPLLDSLTPTPNTSQSAPRLLAPLDPLIYDRVLTSKLWGFDYTWEVYTPPAKRVRGYYALPVLHGLELTGHVDPKADRDAGKLRLVSKSVRRGTSVSEATRELASFLGLR